VTSITDGGPVPQGIMITRGCWSRIPLQIAAERRNNAAHVGGRKGKFSPEGRKN
jgi:hypothetical protein